MKPHLPAPVTHPRSGARIGFIAFGSSDYAVRESQDQLRDEHGIAADYLRLRAFPFSPEVGEFIRNHDRVYVVEQNRDAQMLTLMKIEYGAEEIARLRSLRYYGGLPLDARTVTDEVVRMEGK
jgi:2-oxoglutarate ferredoxin oxidoreductase subunit alpha